MTVPQLDEKVCGEKGGEPARTDQMGLMALIKVLGGDACVGCRGCCDEVDLLRVSPDVESITVPPQVPNYHLSSGKYSSPPAPTTPG